MLVINRDIFLRTLCVISTTAIFIARSAGLGDLEAAANQILLNFVMFTSFGMDGIAFSAEALIGEAIGRRNLQQFRKVVRTVLVWTAILALLNVLIYLLFGLRIVYLMTDLEMVRRIAETYLIWSIMMPLVSSWAFSFDGIFIGATRTKTMRNTMFLAFAVFLSIVFLPFYELNNHFLWLAFFMFLTVRGGLLVACYPRLQRSLERIGVS
jgi:MATE family multidrug resistance protein